MKRKLFIVSILLFISIIYTCVYYFSNKSKTFRCDAQVNISYEHSNVTVDMHVSSLSFRNGNDIVYLNGYISKNGSILKIKRRMFFLVENSKINGLDKTRVLKYEKDTIDNVPEEIWEEFVFQKKKGQYFNREEKSINRNAVIYQEISNPFFICARL